MYRSARIFVLTSISILDIGEIKGQMKANHLTYLKQKEWENLLHYELTVQL